MKLANQAREHRQLVDRKRRQASEHNPEDSREALREIFTDEAFGQALVERLMTLATVEFPAWSSPVAGSDIPSRDAVRLRTAFLRLRKALEVASERLKGQLALDAIVHDFDLPTWTHQLTILEGSESPLRYTATLARFPRSKNRPTDRALAVLYRKAGALLHRAGVSVLPPRDPRVRRVLIELRRAATGEETENISRAMKLAAEQAALIVKARKTPRHRDTK